MWEVGEPRGLPMEKIGEGQHVYAHSKCSHLGGDNILKRLYNYCDAYFKVTYRDRATQR